MISHFTSSWMQKPNRFYIYKLFFFCGQGRLWLSFLTAIYLIHGTTFIMYAFLWEKKHVTNCLYILAPCKVFFFLYKSSIVWHSPIINHYFTDKLWKCDPGIHHAKYLLQQEKKHFFLLFLNDFFFFSFQIYELCLRQPEKAVVR